MRVPSTFHKNTYEISGRNAIRRVLPMTDDQNTISKALTLTVLCLSRECMISLAKTYTKQLLNTEWIEDWTSYDGKRRNEQTKERLLVEQWSFKDNPHVTYYTELSKYSKLCLLQRGRSPHLRYENIIHAFAIILVVKLINSRDTFQHGFIGLSSTLIYNKFIAIYDKQLQHIIIVAISTKWMLLTIDFFFRSINQDVGVKGCYFFFVFLSLSLSFMYKLIVWFIVKSIRINISSVKLYSFFTIVT